MMTDFQKMSALRAQFPSLQLAFQFYEVGTGWCCNIIVTAENARPPKLHTLADLMINPLPRAVGYSADTPEEALDKAIKYAQKTYGELMK